MHLQPGTHSVLAGLAERDWRMHSSKFSHTSLLLRSIIGIRHAHKDHTDKCWIH